MPSKGSLWANMSQSERAPGGSDGKEFACNAGACWATVHWVANSWA